ncbi:hypothetical protein HPB52_017241 [Rhipicephalus sanguineus]|uniref:LRRCT domain-containing protein n=1 Tax=Rhipicephalus sanguineus TaxID=34632 RepID=A0A9D4SYS7_RHISA|nr:hypothetical protein HPB52_017241 [Rhipicephalus sanguineus]
MRMRVIVVRWRRCPAALVAGLLQLLLVLSSAVAGAMAQWFHRACPSRQLIGPSCQCADKTKGLDVICERVERADRLRESLAAVADAQHPVLYLKIKEVRLERFPPGLLDGLEISHLLVHHSNVSEIHLDAFRGVGDRLESLDLSQNALEEVPSESLQGVAVLQQLLLHENRIDELLPDRFPLEGRALDILNLADNRIQTLPEAAFARLGSLVSLELERNGLVDIHPDAFLGVHATMEWLKLGYNYLSEVPSEALQNLTALRELDLRGNNISAIASDAFAGFGASLKFLYLQKNRVQYIEAGAFDEMNSLEWLYLHSNEIVTLTHDVFKPLLGTLSILDVHDNPFHCDCELSWLRLLLQGQSNIVVNQPRETRCASPEEHASTALVELPGMQCAAPASLLRPGGDHLLYASLRTALAALALLHGAFAS